jgi:hypothetical protein
LEDKIKVLGAKHQALLFDNYMENEKIMAA